MESSPAASSSATTDLIQLSLSTENTALAHGDTHHATGMISLQAPEAPERERAPLEIVAVVDRSGSMSGQKINSMKQTLSFLVAHGLQAADTFGIVSFDSSVETRLPQTSMDTAGKKAAREAIGDIHPGGATNLSGGLLQGIDNVLKAPKAAATAGKTVLLFTDGQANNGIREPEGIIAAATGAMSEPCTIFTFGFGSDHNEDLLRSLAEPTNGLYYFIDKAEDIPNAFADCLGGLVSVMAQNVTLALTGGGAVVGGLLSHYKSAVVSGVLEISLGDLYAEDEKDILVELTVPPLPEPREAAAPAVTAVLRYFSVLNSRMETVEAALLLSRPAATPPAAPPNLRLDEQRNRVVVAKALEEASAAADRGDLASGRAMLRSTLDKCAATPSARSPIVQDLMADATRVLAGYDDHEQYRMYGSKMSKMSAMSHQMQRSSHACGAAYSKKSKTAMKAAWLASPAPPPAVSAPAAMMGMPSIASVGGALPPPQQQQQQQLAPATPAPPTRSSISRLASNIGSILGGGSSEKQ